MRTLRYIWALPTSCIGLGFLPLALLSRGGARWVDGVLEIHGGAVAFFLTRLVPMPGRFLAWLLRRDATLAGGASAMTLGHVVLGCDRDALNWTRRHERVHVRQCERWGPLFLPAYGIASIIAVFQKRDAYYGNAFEREAYDNDARAARNDP